MYRLLLLLKAIHFIFQKYFAIYFLFFEKKNIQGISNKWEIFYLF